MLHSRMQLEVEAKNKMHTRHRIVLKWRLRKVAFSRGELTGVMALELLVRKERQ